MQRDRALDRESYRSEGAGPRETRPPVPELGERYHAETGMPQYGAWTSSQIGGGGYQMDVVPHPVDPDRLYVWTDVGGLWRSDDGGERWYSLLPALPAAKGHQSVDAMSVDPRDPDAFVVSLGSRWTPPAGVFRTTDGGRSFERVLTAKFRGNDPHRFTGDGLARHPRDPDTIVAAPIGSPLRRSRDSGRTWERLTDGPAGVMPTDVRFNPNDPGELYLCAGDWSGEHTFDDHREHVEFDGGLWRSDDAGDSWQRPGGDSWPTELRFDPDVADRVYGIFDQARVRMSTDSGETWTDHSDGLELGDPGLTQPTRYSAIGVDPAGDFLLVGSGTGDIYRMPAGGDEWTKVYEPDPETIEEGGWWGAWDGTDFRHFGSEMASIRVDPHDSDHWLFTDWYGTYQSDDAGRSWRLTLQGIELTVVLALEQDYGDDDVVHLGMADNSYFRSADGGETFGHGSTMDYQNCAAVATTPADADRVYACDMNWTDSGGVFRSDDGGDTWKECGYRGLPTDEPAATSLSAHPDDEDRVVAAVGGEGIYRSVDAGRTWAAVADGSDVPITTSSFDEPRQVAVSGDGSMVAAGVGIVQRYDPDGDRWFEVTPHDGAPNQVEADHFAHGRFAVAYEDHGLLVTDDAGRTWETVSDATVSHVTFDGHVEGRVAASTRESGVILSDDGGETWTELDHRLPYRVENVLTFAGDRVVAGSPGCGVFFADISGACSPSGSRPEIGDAGRR